MKPPPVTLARVNELIAYHEKKLIDLRLAHRLLSGESADIAFYEAYIQADNSGHRSIMAEGTDLLDVCRHARRLDADHNDGRNRSIEVFVRIGDIRAALLPEDARGLLPEEFRYAFSFHLDPRLSGVKPRNLVFRVSEPLPSSHYPSTPTPDRQAVPA